MLNNILNIDGVELLSRDQQKTIKGSLGTCGAYLPSGSQPAQDMIISGESFSHNADGSEVWRGISKDEAMALIEGNSGARWCCDSCSSASWY
ncbi:MAG: hypothetical protein AAF600_11050 [Bacteroidota bacterium]